MTRDLLNTSGFELPKELLSDNRQFYEKMLADESFRVQYAPGVSRSDAQQNLKVINFCRTRNDIRADGRISNNRAVAITVEVLEFVNAHKTEKSLKFGDPKSILETHNIHELVKRNCQARKDLLGQVIEENVTYSLGNGKTITGVVVLTQGVDDKNLPIELNSNYLSVNYNFSTYADNGSFFYFAKLTPGAATSSRAIGYRIDKLVTMFDVEIEKTTELLIPQFAKVPKTNNFKPSGFKSSIKKEFLLEN